jgi:ABC-2 type transport system ATP-binding protein
MSTLRASNISKSFNGNKVVQDISFSVEQGEVFGMVGPNGAGKTTTIRMLMDIIKPDSGEIEILGQPIHEDTKNRIGYLPEERGLYRKLTVIETLTYLASLKNIKVERVRKRADELLKMVDMLPHQNKKIEELSRGMGQLIQFIATIIHNPDLVIFDEPFAGLDPINKRIIKEMMLELKEQGKTVILSTHMMSEVEELCDRILMINKGCEVLYGSLTEIKSRYRNDSIFVECDGEIGRIEGVSGSKSHGAYTELFLTPHTSPQMVLSQLLSQGVVVNKFEVSTPSLDEIFIRVVEDNR